MSKKKKNRPPLKKCPATGKVRFVDELAAEYVVVRAQFRARILNDHRRREQRAYPCTGCGGWHVTSQPLS